MKKKNEAMAIAFTRPRMTTASALVREDHRVIPTTLRQHRERCCPRMKAGSGRIRSCK